MDDKKKQFRLEGVPFIKDIKRYARNIETTMNKLHEEGYNVSVIDQGKAGTLIAGKLEEAQPRLELGAFLGGILGKPGTGLDDPYAALSQQTAELVRTIFRAAGTSDPEKLAIEVPKQLPKVASDCSADVLSTAVKECREEADAHSKGHNDPTCHVPAALRVIADSLHTFAQSRLQ